VVALDLDGDGVKDLITETHGGQLKVDAFGAVTGAAKALGTIEFPAGTDPAAVWVAPQATGPGSQLAVARTDGYLTVYDAKLMAANAVEGDRPGLRVGGYYAPGGWRDLQRVPISAALDDKKMDRIVVPDSRGALLRLDADQASLSSPPRRVWEKTHTLAPTAIKGLGGSGFGVVAIGLQEPVTEPPSYLLYGLGADGAVVWKQNTESAPINDLVPGKFDGDALLDFAFEWGNPGDVLLRTRSR